MICKNFDNCKYWFCKEHKICLYHYVSLPRKDRMQLMGIEPLPKQSGKPVIKCKRTKIKDGRWSVKDEQIFTKTNGICWLCGEPIKFKSQYSRDHKIPLSRGGASSIDNLFPAHIKCNGMKGNMIIANSETFLAIFKPHLILGTFKKKEKK